MKALITGGAGFIGSHLTEHLLGAGDSVVVLDNLSTGRWENICHLAGSPGFSYFIGPVDDVPLLHEAGHDCDVVYHLAAAVGVELIVRDPITTIETNVNGTEAVLRFAVRYGKRVLLASTSEVYGKGVKTPFSEDDDIVYGPTSRARWSYGISKAVDEFLLQAYCRSKGLTGIIVRLFNTVGPRQIGLYGMVIPRFVDQAMNGGPITVYGDGQQTRCFGHVLDVVPALRQLTCLPNPGGQVVNLGSDEKITILELAERVRGKVNPRASIQRVPYEKAFGPSFEDMHDRQPDLRRARDLIGYAPTRSLDDILDDIVAYRSAGSRATPDVGAEQRREAALS